MEKVEFLVGSEKRFSEFISKLNEKDKIALLTHDDLDGVTSGKIVDKVIGVDVLKLVDYKELNDSLIEELKNKKITKIIITDLGLNGDGFLDKLAKFAEILIIDHHTFHSDINSDKIVFLNSQKNCAAYMCYYLFSKTQNIEELDWLVTCACVSDWDFKNNTNFLGETYKKYDDVFAFEGDSVRKSGKIWDLQYNLSLFLIYFRDDLKKAYELIPDNYSGLDGIKKYAEIVRKEISESVKRFDKEKETYGDIYFWEFNPKFEIKSVVSTLVSVKEKNKTFIIGSFDDKFCLLSARRQDNKVNVAELLCKLINGLDCAVAGGHPAAAGGRFLKKDFEEFRERLKMMSEK